MAPVVGRTVACAGVSMRIPSRERISIKPADTPGQVLQQRGVSRRSFLKYCLATAGLLAMPRSRIDQLAHASSQARRRSVVWLSFRECTGCTESLTRAWQPSIEQLILDILWLDCHHILQAALLFHRNAFKTLPELNELNRPRMYYGESVHQRCSRLHFYAQGKFAESFDDEGGCDGGCLYELGCRGPVTYNACTRLGWNIYDSHCVYCHREGPSRLRTPVKQIPSKLNRDAMRAPLKNTRCV